MSSRLKINPLSASDIQEYGLARVRDQAYDALRRLWSKRQKAGMTQARLAEMSGMNPARVCRMLSGPANLTFRTFGALVEALDGEVEISVFARDDVPVCPENYRSYDDFEKSTGPVPIVHDQPVVISERKFRVSTSQ